MAGCWAGGRRKRDEWVDGDAGWPDASDASMRILGIPDQGKPAALKGGVAQAGSDDRDCRATRSSPASRDPMSPAAITPRHEIRRVSFHPLITQPPITSPLT